MSPVRKPSDEVEVEAIVSEPETPEPAVRSKAPKKGPAARVSANSWWCPNDDTAMPLEAEACATCGYERTTEE